MPPAVCVYICPYLICFIAGRVLQHHLKPHRSICCAALRLCWLLYGDLWAGNEHRDTCHMCLPIMHNLRRQQIPCQQYAELP